MAQNADVLKVLSENEQKELERIANSTDAINALKKVLLFDVYHNGVMEAGEAPNAHRNFAWSIVTGTPRGELADRLATVCEASVMIESAFADVEAFKTPIVAEIVTSNPGR